MIIANNRRSLGFTLLEVVVATAIAAGAIVAVVALLGPMTKRVSEIVDSETAARLSENIQTELSRLGFGFASVEILDAAPIYIYATPDGNVARRGPNPEDEPTSDATEVNYNLESGSPVGIARRDRFFLVTLHQARVNDREYTEDASGTVSLRAEVIWPYRIPAGPTSSAAASGGDPAFDPSELVPQAQRRSLVLYFAVRP